MTIFENVSKQFCWLEISYAVIPNENDLLTMSPFSIFFWSIKQKGILTVQFIRIRCTLKKFPIFTTKSICSGETRNSAWELVKHILTSDAKSSGTESWKKKNRNLLQP